MKKILTAIALLISISQASASAGSVFDDLANLAAQKAINYKINGFYKKAMSCDQLEVDPINGKTAREWMELKPEIPDWKTLERFSSIAQNARDYAARKDGTDKIKHCFAGCFISKNLDLKSAKMTGWIKELVDASDCSASSHFEESDYYATLGGAIAAKEVGNCDEFCHRDDLQDLNGEQIYEQANKLEK